jgi:hypothetical protein
LEKKCKGLWEKARKSGMSHPVAMRERRFSIKREITSNFLTSFILVDYEIGVVRL